jgi:hypothetical protein
MRITQQDRRRTNYFAKWVGYLFPAPLGNTQ